MMTDVSKRIIVALDFPLLAPALDIAEKIGQRVGMLKVGLELFNSEGPHAIQLLRDRGAQVFYDAKFYDIPNTAAGAAAAAGRLGLAMLNVHALGGRAMMEAARQAAHRGAEEAGFPPPLVIAVTVVTSLGEAELREELGMPTTAAEQVLRLASLAREAGLDGVVCSAGEVLDIKRSCGEDFLTVTPGIRPTWARAGDQVRVATPRDAVAAGADYLVIGRPITGADDSQDALEKVVAEMAASA
jgi:orotidine-5'-phosphate decarboxylase